MGGVGKGLRLSYPLGRTEDCGAQSNVSCGPPRSEASARASRWAANALPFSVGFILARSQRRTKTERKRSISALRIRGLRADRCHGNLAICSRLKAWPRVQPNSPPKSKPHARPSAAGKPQSVFAPEEQLQPKARPSSPPRVRFTAAPLALRRFFARLRDSFYFGLSPK